MALLKFEPGGVTPTSAVMTALFVLQGIMMIDLVGLAGAGG